MTTVLDLLTPLAILVATGYGIGCWLRPRGETGDATRPRGVAVTTLMGLLLLASLLSNLSLLGIPRAVLSGIAYAAALCGFRRGVAPGRPRRAEIVFGLLFLALLASPILISTIAPPLSRDAVVIWWPKVKEVAAGRAADVGMAPAPGTLHMARDYPRGLAQLAALGTPWGEPDPRWVRLVPLLFTWLGAWYLVACGRAFRNVVGVGLAAALFLSLPEVAVYSHDGHADVPLACAILVTGVAVTRRHAQAWGHVPMVVGALGAAAIKMEGTVILLSVASITLWDLWRRPSRRSAALLSLVALASPLPWWMVRADATTGVPAVTAFLRETPDLLIPRIESLGRGIRLFFTDAVALYPELTEQWAFRPLPYVALVALLIAIPRGPRRASILPAAVLLLADLAIYTVTSNHQFWQIRVSFDRLLLQVTPLLLLIASDRLTSPGPGHAAMTDGEA